MSNYCLQLRTVLHLILLRRVRHVPLFVVSLLTSVLISVIFPQDKLKLTSGFLTILYSFFVWVSIAAYTIIDDKKSGFRSVLVANGLRPSVLIVGQLCAELIFCLAISVIGQLLHQLDLIWTWAFFYRYEEPLQLLVCQFLFGLTYLLLTLVFSKVMNEKFSIILANLMGTTTVFLLFGNRDQTPDISGENPEYFYFGINYVLTSIHNGYIAGFLSLALLIFYIIIELGPCSKGCKTKANFYSSVKSNETHFGDSGGGRTPMISEEVVLNLIGVTHRYGKFKALQNLSLTFYENQITLIVGKNGSGKSTLLRLLASQQRPTQGIVQVDLGSIGYCHQENNLPSECTVSELFNFFFALNNKGVNKHERAQAKQQLLREIGLLHHQNSFYGRLSVGMKRKCGLMIALIHSPQILLLDEPMSGLDVEFQTEFWQILNKLKTKRSIIVVTHDINQAIADRCVVLNRGKVLQIFSMNELKAKCSYYFRVQAKSKTDTLHCLRETSSFVQHPQSSLLTLETSRNFIEYRVLRSDLKRLEEIITHHFQDELIVATVTLEQQVMAIVNNQEDEVIPPRAWDLLLKQNLQIFEKSYSSSMWVQFYNLWSRRSRALWLKPRVAVSALLVYFVISVEVLLIHMNPQFVPYRLHAVYSYFLVQDTVQRYYHLKLNTYLSGTSVFIYHVANILADSLLLICVSFLWYLCFNAYVSYSYPSLNYDDINILGFTVLGILGTSCLYHLLGLTVTHPVLAQGLFHLPISYFGFFIFNFTPLPLFLLPNILSAYASLRQFSGKIQLSYEFLESISNWEYYLVLIFQIVFYSALLIFFDLLLHRHLKPRSAPPPHDRLQSYDPQPPALQAKFKDRYLDQYFQFSLNPANILCLYGPPESGKSSLVHLLSKLINKPRTRYIGRCEVMQSNILSERPTPFPMGSVSLCIEKDLFDPNFTAYQQLWFIGKLRSVPTPILYSQIFFVSKLLQLQSQLQKKIRNLSGGNRRKVSVACALLGSPQLLLIDEPTLSLDPGVAKSLLLGLQFMIHRIQNSLLFTSKKIEQHLLIADQVLQMSSKTYDMKKHYSKALWQIFTIKIVYSFPKKGTQWRTSFQVSPLSASHSYTADDSSQIGPDEVYALTLTFKELKEELVPFLKQLGEHDGIVRQILID